MADRHAEPRVTHVVPALFDRAAGVIGGAERYAFELARYMASRVPTTLLAFGDAAREETDGPLRVRVLGPARYVRGQRANPFTLSLFGELRRADVVHCHQQHIVASSAAALFGRCTGRRVFVSNLGGGGWDVSGYVSTDRWYAGHLHISEYSRRLAGHEGKPWARVILGGVDLEKFSPDPAAARSRAVAFVGRLLPHKGVDVLVRALPPGVAADVVGPAPDARYRADLGRLAAGKPVRFRGACDDEELVEVYRSALCVALPSVYRSMYGQETRAPELLGQTLLEAMACGTPVLGTTVASIPEVVEDGVTGFLVPPGDAEALGARIAWLAAHPADAARMGEAARRRAVERFDWMRVVDRCLEAYAAPHGAG